MSNECSFELKPLHCDNCGAFLGDLGTCDDHAFCQPCAIKLFGTDRSIKGPHVWQPDYDNWDEETDAPKTYKPARLK